MSGIVLGSMLLFRIVLPVLLLLVVGQLVAKDKMDRNKVR